MEKYFVQVNGGLWVKDSWSQVGSVMLTTNRDEVSETISTREIDWLKTKFSDVKLFQVTLQEVAVK